MCAVFMDLATLAAHLVLVIPVALVIVAILNSSRSTNLFLLVLFLKKKTNGLQNYCGNNFSHCLEKQKKTSKD